MPSKLSLNSCVCTQVIDLLCHLILANMQIAITLLNPNEFALKACNIIRSDRKSTHQILMMPKKLHFKQALHRHIICNIYTKCVFEKKHVVNVLYVFYSLIVVDQVALIWSRLLGCNISKQNTAMHQDDI